MIERIQSKTQKTKVIILYDETPKQFLKPTHQGPKKSKMTPKLSQNQMLELKELQDIEIVQLLEQTPKQFLNQPPPKTSPFGPQNVNNYPKTKSKSKVRIKETQKMKIVQLYEQALKQFFNPARPQKQPIKAPKIEKMTQKLSQNQKSELKELFNYISRPQSSF